MKRMFVVAAILMMAACGTSRKVEKVATDREVVVRVTDTVREYIHDTNTVKESVIDSTYINERVREWTDSVGKIHIDRERDLVRVVSSTTEESRTLRIENEMLRNELAEAKSTSKSERVQEKVVEKKIYVWWPCLAIIPLFIYLKIRSKKSKK